jgi:hypothetical protein
MAIERIWPDISEDHTLAMDIGISNRIVGTSYGFGSTKTFTLVYANVNGTEFGELVTSIKDSPNIINDFELYQNYPNPFNPGTKIKYSVPGEGFVSLKVYDVLGNEIATLINEEKPAGNYEVEFDANGLPSGIYFYQLKSNKYIETKKMNLLK